MSAYHIEFTAEAQDAMKAALDYTWEFVDEQAPSVEDVFDEALASLAVEARERADDLATCNHVDDCTARAIALRSIASQLEELSGR